MLWHPALHLMTCGAAYHTKQWEDLGHTVNSHLSLSMWPLHASHWVSIVCSIIWCGLIVICSHIMSYWRYHHRNDKSRMEISPVTLSAHLPLDKMAAILADDNFKCIFLNENDRILIEISLKFVPRSPTDNKTALVHVMAWRRTGDKPLSEPMLTPFSDACMRH